MKRRKQEMSSPLQAPPASAVRQEGALSKSSEAAGTKATGFPIVGIGASAGGLEAAEQFLSNLPADTGMGLVLVSHLDPHHKSSLVELLAKHTGVQVRQAEDGVKVTPNCLYVIPPSCYLQIEDRTLRLIKLDEERAPHMAIDHFLRSLAEDQKENGVAVILSGNGTDGTLGLRAINGAGGITLVQDPETARFDGMPRSAISTGLANFVLPPAEMPKHLLECLERLAANHLITAPARTSGPEAGLLPLQRIHAILRARTGSDFSHYKGTSVSRRIGRRMGIHRLDDLADYARFLEEHPEEVQVLFRDLLIGVTSFFRDQAAFEELKARILPHLLQDRPDGSCVRIWVPGCATGEEAYSIAIVLKEYMEEQNRAFDIQIFGTDLDHEAITRARQGRFPSNIAADVSSERLKRFFEESDSGYVIKKEIREWLVLSEHNVMRDAPFMKLDLLSCRNLLIYLELEVQDQLLPLFHFALRPGGILLLGSSESIGNHLDLFDTVDKKWKFFERRDVQDHRRLKLPVEEQQQSPLSEHRDRTVPSRLRDHDILDRTGRMLLERFSPPCVVTTDKGEVLYIHGRIGKYLEPAPGRMSTNIVDMAREGLRFELQRALAKAVAEPREHVCRPVTIQSDGQPLTVKMSVQPFGQQGLMWVIFQPIEAPRPAEVSGKAGRHRPATLEGELKLELQRTRESLSTTVEELQASNEELRAANEELQSANEEHQSSNEELETSREELQSLNEELLTLNSELSAKVEQASRAESDLKNLLNGLKIGVVFLDTQMGIVRYTPEATRLIKLIPRDIGRPIGDLVSYVPDLVNNAAQVLDTLVPKEIEVRTEAGDWFLMRIMPYRTLDNVITGLVLTFDDITAGKRAGNAALVYAESIAQTVRQPFLVLDSELRVRTANQAFFHLFKVSTQDTIGKGIYDLGNGQWDIPALRNLLQQVLTTNEEVEDFVVEHSFPSIGRRKMLLNAHVVHQVSGGPVIFLAIADLTTEKDSG